MNPLRKITGRPGRLSKLARSLFFLALAGVGIAFFSCKKGEAEGKVLAKVYNKTLHLSELDGMIPDGADGEDSTIIVNAFVQNWVREAALLVEAEKNIPKGLDIDRLVQDYRASLIKNNYENIVVNSLLDSTVTQEQLQEFYQKNREQYQLETPIIRCRFIKAPLTSPQLSLAQNWWGNMNNPDVAVRLKNWCDQNAAVHILRENIWYKVEDIAAYMPRGILTVDNVGSRRDFIQRESKFIYFFKVLELAPKKEVAPLAYIEDQARKVILHKRKVELLEETKTKLYDEAMQKQSVKIYQ